ncbi:hypothetical protein GLOTRDRAFT_111830 [Gloeophyllum trabeum ATCC 11539]|uniref:F-box domain-containing protein n=1 Tax=Gloeophyllum trabeum (strain ATCC 11539 / FP-39264 / Madison 617) TaxID=670483 RepID=S7RFS9_GLOTA|nr:uncharacterized protein GLOTRDRAFT_111830 [Gloeophyllum trabeum ATCC 11539]EPQ53040.1 hypothetical protein GLOTRDRAFT_111830 [Gloeophyllum trabeum ATCC 11539]
MDEYFCSLCGGPFYAPERTKAGPDDPDKEAQTLVEGDDDFEHHYDGKKVSKEELLWLRRLRVIARYNDEREDGRVYPEGMSGCEGYWISGIGYECSLNEATVPYLYEAALPEDRNQYVFDEDQVEANLTVYGEFGNGEPRKMWSYPFHDACFQILAAALAFKEGQLDDSTSIPWNVLHHVFGTHCEADCGVDFALRLDYEHNCIEQYWTTRRGDEQYVSDPVNIRALRELLANPRSLVHNTSSPSKLSSAHTKLDTFARLPPELLFQLVSYLPNSAVASLRLASRSIAALPLETSQTFWLSRIAHLPYIVDADLEWTEGKGGDWREVFKTLKAAGRGEGELADALGFVNRRRIWKICIGLVEEAAALVAGGFKEADIDEGGDEHPEQDDSAGEDGSEGHDETEGGDAS